MRDLATSADDAKNVSFIGPAGVDKTMFAIALGHAPVDADLRTYHCTAADLAARLLHRSVVVDNTGYSYGRGPRAPPASSGTEVTPRVQPLPGSGIFDEQP